MPRPTFRAALVALALCLLALPAAAQASPSQVSIMMDDDLLLYRGDAVRDETMTRMKHVGVDMVRVTVLWSVVAERAKATKRRKRQFEPRNPRTYPTQNWDRYDRLVRAARTLGLRVYFNVTPPGPSWGRGKAPRGLRTVVKRAWRPKPGEFAKFVQAVGRRYSGRFRDENDDRSVLPRVDVWSLLNEPNQGGWLAPQYTRGRAASPAMARQLFLRGRAALDRSGHGRDTILFGETAPLGSSRRTVTSPMYPKRFLRELLCTRSRGRGCSAFDKYGPIRATGIAHHPYTKNVSPTTRDRSKDSITMANLGDLGRTVDAIARKTGNIRRGLPVWLTEFGFETNPPDPFSGVSLARQAQWNQIGERLAFDDRRVAGLAQFLLRDVPPVRGARRGTKPYWFTYQSGIEFADGSPKPSLNGYVFPFLARVRGGAADVWGQLRFRPNGLPPGAQDTVEIQHSADGGGSWSTVGTVAVTNPLGYFTGSVVVPGGGQLRAVWSGTPVASLPQGL